MFAITRDEADYIRKASPSVKIVRTMKQKSKRSHYFCDETVEAIRALRHLREKDSRAE